MKDLKNPGGLSNKVWLWRNAWNRQRKTDFSLKRNQIRKRII